MKIYIKNMACKSCVEFVKEALGELEIVAVNVVMGEVDTKEDMSDDQKHAFGNKIKVVGLELLEKKQGILVEKIKNVIHDYVNLPDEKPNMNFSTLLSDELNHSYNYLSNLFSEVEATTITQYLISVKIERAKELIILEEYSLAEIAYKLHYSSASHFTSQFKNITGLSPSHFKQLKEKRRVSIQEI